MDERDSIISVLCEEIDDKEILKAVIDKHEKSGQSLYSILKEESASIGLDEEQLTKIIAAGNQIEFINLSADMVDPIAASISAHWGIC